MFWNKDLGKRKTTLLIDGHARLHPEQDAEVHARYIAFRSIRNFIRLPLAPHVGFTRSSQMRNGSATHVQMKIDHNQEISRKDDSAFAYVGMPEATPAGIEDSYSSETPVNLLRTGSSSHEPLSQTQGFLEYTAPNQEGCSFSTCGPGQGFEWHQSDTPAAALSISATNSDPNTASSTSNQFRQLDFEQDIMIEQEVELKVFLRSALHPGGSLNKMTSNIYKAVNLSSNSAVLFTRYLCTTTRRFCDNICRLL